MSTRSATAGREPRRRRPPTGPLSPQAGRDGGFALLEVAIAFVLLAGMMVATTSLVRNALEVGSNSRLRQLATDIASSTLDCAVASLNVAAANFPTPCGEPRQLITEMGFSGLNGVPALATVSRGGVSFTIEQEVQPGSGTCGVPAGGAPPELQVTDWVSWAPGLSTSSMWWEHPASLAWREVEETTVVAVPAIALDPADGSIKVQVTDDVNAGQPGLVVTATNVSTGQQSTALTTDLGCALFLNMVPGAYTVSVAPQPGGGTYIDSNNDMSGGSPAPLAGNNMDGDVQASATLTLPSAAPYYYARAATVSASYSVPQIEGLSWQQPFVSSPGDLASSFPLSLYSTGLLNSPTLLPAPGASGDPVFPFHTSPSYYAVAGTCGADSTPDGFVKGVPADGVAVPASGWLSEGSSATVNFTLAPVAVAVTEGGSELSGAKVLARPTDSVPNGGPDGNCSSAGAAAMPAALDLGSTSAATPPQPGGQSSLALASSADPSISGTTVTLTATASALSGVGTPTGTVTFYINGTVAGSSTLSPAGVATFTPSPALTTGSYTLKASYGGDANFSASSATLTQSVNPAGQAYPTTTSLVSSADPSVSGKPVSFTATVSSPDGTPETGAVQFYNGTSPLGQPVPVSNGLATSAAVTLSSTGSPYTIKAQYIPGADNDFAGSAATLSQVVGSSQDATSVSVSSDFNPVVSGQAASFTATVSSTAGAPTGTVQFRDNGANIGPPVSLVRSSPTSSTATYTGPSLSAPPELQQVTAVYTSSDPNYAGSTSGPFDEDVVSSDTLSSLPDGYWLLWAQSADGTKVSTDTTTAVVLRVDSSGVSKSVCTGGSYTAPPYYSLGSGSCSPWQALAPGALVEVPVS